ncbi:TPA: SAM-dependent methyltransferase [Candidatus Nomurabacteria bacterium]|nr:SAM-dependent methyltransferase [Candidatus Nomurabacteria bacterium]
MKQKILDVCCGSKMFWFDKGDKRVLFTDIRKEKHTLCDGRKLEITPDIIMDFRNLDFKDKTFKLIVFDPPHLKKLGKNSWMAKKYGVLGEDWKNDLSQGFNECWRVLEDNGILIFKWNERDVKVSEVLKLFKEKPLFGHPTGKSGATKWMCFMKV